MDVLKIGMELHPSCKDCNTYLNLNAVFCPRCGSKAIGGTFKASKQLTIENCVLSFECDAKWDELQTTESSESTRYCGRCSKQVYLSTSDEELRFNISQGRCVAFDRPVRPRPLFEDGIPSQSDDGSLQQQSVRDYSVHRTMGVYVGIGLETESDEEEHRNLTTMRSIKFFVVAAVSLALAITLVVIAL